MLLVMDYHGVNAAKMMSLEIRHKLSALKCEQSMMYKTKCDRILKNRSKSHIFIKLYFMLPHEQYYVMYYSFLFVEFIA